MNVMPQIQKLQHFAEARDYMGYDPYDALNSPLARFLSFRTKYGRIALTQFFRRFPINLRLVLLTPKGYNPMAIGLFLWGQAKLHLIERKAKYLETISHLFDLLDELKSPEHSGNCWGYNFDWQSRAFYLPKFTPTIVNSAFIGHALLDTHGYTGESRALNTALTIKDFVINDLNRTVEGRSVCFSYSPIDRTAVHNANLLGASLLTRLYKITGETVLLDTALSSLAYTMNCQHEDGSWFYAEAERQRWTDSFHTGFNLQAIRYFLQEGLAEEYRDDYG